MALDRPALLAAAARIRLLVLDVDGVMTDGRLHYDAEGREFKTFHVRDGFGLVRALDHGLAIAVISGRESSSAAGRMRELRIPHVFLGCADKHAALVGLTSQLGMPREAVACLGDDVPDLPMLAQAGLAVAVADAHPEVLSVAHWRTAAPGGRGAVREVCDLLWEAGAAGRRQQPRPP